MNIGPLFWANSVPLRCGPTVCLCFLPIIFINHRLNDYEVYVITTTKPISHFCPNHNTPPNLDSLGLADRGGRNDILFAVLQST